MSQTQKFNFPVSLRAAVSALAFVFALVVVATPRAQAQTVTFTYTLFCDIDQRPVSNISVAGGVGQLASDVVPIATVSSDVPGYTEPVTVGQGSLTWTSSPATLVQCALSLPKPQDACGATYGNPGGNASITGAVFGLPRGSTLFTASFQGGATSVWDFNTQSKSFSGWINISYINPVILANLGLTGMPNSGIGFLSDAYTRGLSQNIFQVSVTFTVGNLQVLHAFTSGADGKTPYAGLTMDAGGNLYGTASSGGAYNWGTAFKLKRSGSGWTFNPLYSFGNGGSDGIGPFGKLVFGPDGSLYGTTYSGGDSGCGGPGCGTVFKLQPAASACKSALCPWRETVLYRFTESDGDGPASGVTFDKAGNIYGTTSVDGSCPACGSVYQLARLFTLRNE